VFVVHASFGSGAEPQVVGVASSAPRAEELADRYAGEDRYGWRRPDWLEWDSARRVRPAGDGRGNAVEVRLVQVGLDELIRLVLEPEPLVEEHDWRRPDIRTGLAAMLAAIAGPTPHLLPHGWTSRGSRPGPGTG
jgi:hypothetical protein